MTREEELIRKIDNIHLRGRRALETARVFMEFNGNISDIDLAEELIKIGIETSSSTVGRDLTINLEKYFKYLNLNKTVSLGDNQKEILSFIKKKREENKLNARKKGGKNYAKNNTPIKDEFNHFKGSIRNV